jgi:hypothetical protein
VKVIGIIGEMYAGSFRIDSARVSVRLQPSTLSQGQTSTLVFTIPEEAPPGGLEIDVTALLWMSGALNPDNAQQAL